MPFVIKTPIEVDLHKYYVVRIGADFDFDFITDPSVGPNHLKTRLFSMTTDPFLPETPREFFKQFVDPLTEHLPTGSKGLDYYVLYHDGTSWNAFDIETLPEPRTWGALREATGLEDL